MKSLPKVLAVILGVFCIFAVSVRADDTCWHRCYDGAACLCTSGDWQDAFQKSKMGLSLAQAKFGSEHMNTAKSFEQLGDICEAWGRFEQGVLFHKKALDVRTKVCGENHPQVIKSLAAIGELHRMLGTYGEAEQCYKKILQISEKGGWGQSSGAVTALEGLGIVYVNQGKPALAEPLFKKALAVYENGRKYRPAEDLGVARNLIHLAGISKDRNDFREAAELYKRAIRTYSSASGPSSPMIAHCWKGLGEVYVQWHKPRRAIKCFKTALGAHAKTGLPEGPMVGATLVGLANVYKTKNQPDKANALYDKAEAIYAKSLGMDWALASRILRHARIWPRVSSGRLPAATTAQ
jgi:tetratricopeptide (TPR) repeat protein